MPTDLPLDLMEQYRKLKTEIEQSLVEFIVFPEAKVWNLMKQLALVCLILRNKRQGVYYLMNCHGFDLRIRSLLRFDNLLKEGIPRINLDRKYLQFCGHYDKSGLDSMLDRLRVLPSEWKVIQVSVIFNPESRWLEEEYRYVTPRLCVSVFECGVNTKEPLIVSIRRNQDTTTIWDHFLKSLRLNREKYKESNYLLKQKKKLLSIREMEETLNFMRKDMFGIWISLFVGNYIDEELQHNLVKTVDEILNDLKLLDVIVDTDRQVLYQIIKCFTHLSDQEFELGVNLIAKSCDKDICETLVVKLRTMCKNDKHLGNAPRHPVILVLDDQLEGLPWECLDVLIEHPVSRVPSIPHLHALYEDYKDYIRCGAVEYNMASTEGFYIINPNQNLNKSQQRLEPYMKENFPSWKGVIGKKPTNDEITYALTESVVYMYCGHGSGGHLFSPNKVMKLNVRSVILMFGCGSNLWDNNKKLNTSRAYCISGSPCVVGMLWEVGDADSDAVAMKILNSWLVPGTTREPEILRALIKGRCEAQDFLNKTALIARGLPVRILSRDK